MEDVEIYMGLSGQELRERIASLKELRSREGRGRGPEAAHVRAFVKGELRRIQAELSKRGKARPAKSIRNLGWNSARGNE